MRRPLGQRTRGFTLIELLVVVAIIGLLISILLPSLRRAREQAKSVVCLSNLRVLGQGFTTYSIDVGVLPGPLHPAVYRDQGIDVYIEDGFSLAHAEFLQSRQITFLLRGVFNDRDATRENSMTDQVSTCPTMAGIVSDSDYKQWVVDTNRRGAFPTHYTLNNWGTGGDPDPGPVGNPRPTDPEFYFGLSPSGGSVPPGDLGRPKPIEQIKRASEEWAIADSWYRPRSSSVAAFQQEGPYQSGWTGAFLPYYPPHGKNLGTYSYLPDAQRQSTAVAHSNQGRQGANVDGVTNSVFFDGHAAGVRSKTAVNAAFGNTPILYGFPGTVNPKVSDAVKTGIIWQ